MKILKLAPYIFVEDHPYASKNQSGLAYMIRNVADMLSENNDVYVLTQSILTRKMSVGKWTLLGRSYFTIFQNFKFRYLKHYLTIVRQLPSLKMQIKALFYYLSAGQVECEIKRIAPDVIHIHGIGLYTIPYFLAAAKFNIPVLTTLHGLLSFHDIVPASPFIKRLERNFLKTFIDQKYALTFISSGMKDKVEKHYNCNAENIMTIPNSYKEPPFPIEIHQSVDKSVKHLICIGAIYELKNHIQVIRIMSELQNRFEGKHEIFLDILGDGPLRNYLENYVSENNIKNVQFFGRVSQQKVYEHLTQSDLLVFPSIEEGFGMPMIEAYRCGVPVVAFKDIDAAADVADHSCIIFAEDRSGGALVDSIEIALTRSWDANKIYEYSQRFSFENIGEQYNRAVHSATKSINYNKITDIILESVHENE